jgi:hypothetical protein
MARRVGASPTDFVTATATDAANNTSEFAQNQVVPGTPSLTIDSRQFPARLGGIINLSLNAGPARAGRLYLIVATLSGTAPGTPLGAITVPLNADPFTNVVLAFTPSPMFAGFFGNLDGQGQASAQMNMLGVFNQSWAGTRMHFAYILFPFDYASNPVAGHITSW